MDTYYGNPEDTIKTLMSKSFLKGRGKTPKYLDSLREQGTGS